MEQTMTKVLKLLGGGSLVAILSVVLFAASAAAESPPSPPARFVGSVKVDGAAPAAGTLIEARIGNAACGSGAVFMSGSEARYTLDSPALDPGATPNCGVDGAVVTFYIGGKKANETGTWANYQLNTVNLTYTTPTATTGTGTPSATPGAPVTGDTPITSGDSASAAWLYAVLGLSALAFGVGGATVARRSR
jgi:hypothetical protein